MLWLKLLGLNGLEKALGWYFEVLSFFDNIYVVHGWDRSHDEDPMFVTLTEAYAHFSAG